MKFANDVCNNIVDLSNDTKLKDIYNNTHLIIKKDSPYLESRRNIKRLFPAHKKLKKDLVFKIETDFMSCLEIIDGKIFYKKSKYIYDRKNKKGNFFITYINLSSKNVKIEFVNDDYYQNNIYSKKIFLSCKYQYINQSNNKKFYIKNIHNINYIEVLYDDNTNDILTKKYIYDNCVIDDNATVFLIRTKYGYFSEPKNYGRKNDFNCEYAYDRVWNNIKRYKSKKEAIIQYSQIDNCYTHTFGPPAGNKQSVDIINIICSEFTIVEVNKFTKEIINEDKININLNELSRKINITENYGSSLYKGFLHNSINNIPFFGLYYIIKNNKGHGFFIGKKSNINLYLDKIIKTDISKYEYYSNPYTLTIIVKDKLQNAFIKIYLINDDEYIATFMPYDFFYKVNNKPNNQLFRYNELYYEK